MRAIIPGKEVKGDLYDIHAPNNLQCAIIFERSEQPSHRHDRGCITWLIYFFVESREGMR